MTAVITFEIHIDKDARYCGSKCRYAMENWCALFSYHREWYEEKQAYGRPRICYYARSWEEQPS